MDFKKLEDMLNTSRDELNSDDSIKNISENIKNNQYSDAYLEICDFYVGPELPRETFFDSKDSLNELYFMFLMSLFFMKK